MNTSRLIRVVLGATLFAMSDVAEGQPALSIELEDARTVRLSWPVAAGDFVLEETAALSGAPTWTTLPLTPTRVGDQFVVLLVASEEGRYFRLRQQTVPPVPLTTIRESSPRTGESGVAVTRETIVYFTEALASGVTLGPDQFFAEFGGRRLLSRVELSSDRHKATLFFLENLPGSARVRVTLNGDGLTDAFNRPVDFDGDEQPGGSAVLTFETLSITPIPGTAVIGHVFASELQPGPATGTGAVNKPLAGVTITVDGMEQTLRAVTDANGFFKLSPVPGGRFFVHIDGRTVADVAAGIRYPDMAHYPFVGKAWDAVPGRADNLAGGREDTAAGATGKIYLPLIRPGTLQTVSMTEDTTITFPPEVVAANPALQGVTITVPANALFADNGTRGGKVGIAPVPPDRLPGPLPPGLNAALVITVQTDGALNFDQPAPICFPNLPDPLTQQVPPPGSKRELFSFDHDKGIWEPVGSMTVTPDGKLVCSDPGVGIRQPGWHTLAPAGTRNDPPCFSTFEEDLVVVPPDPLRQGLQDHLFVGDEGELLIAVGNNARPIDRKKDPCDPVNRRATPLVVQITTDALRGELFYESLPANATQLLLPGQQIFYKVRPKKLLTDAIIHRSQANILFGNEIRVAGFSYGEGKLLFEDVFYLYRLFDIGDNDHVDGIIDFEKTFADGPEKAVQTKPWALRFGHATKKTVLEMESTGHALGVEFEAHAGQVIFDPVPGAGSRTDILRVRTPAGHVAGTLKTRGEAVAPQKVTFSREDFAEALGQFVDRRPAPILAEQFLALFPADSDGDGFRSSERGFGEKVDALYEATQNKLRGAEGSIFGGLGALVLDALEWVNDDRRQGIYVAPRLAGPFAAGDTITQAGYAADQTGRTIDLMDSLNARYHLSIGAVDPGVEVEFIFEHSISGEVWVPLQSLLIRSEHARFTGIYPQKLVRNFHRARTIHRGEAGGAAYGVVVTGDNNVCDRSITGGCALWADFNKDDFVRYDSDTPPNLVGGLAAQEAMFSPLQKRWLFDQLLNRTRNESFGIIPGGVIVNLDLLAERLLGVPAAQVEDGFTTLLANTIAHEVGHDLGAIHLRDATHDYIEGDLMGRDASNHAMPARFRFFEPLIRQALGFPIFLREANGLWDYYARWEALETYAHNIALPHPNDHPDDLGVPFPVLSVFAAPLVVGQASAAAVTEVNFADTIADGAGGAVSSISLYLVNDGDQPLEVTQVRLRSGDNRFTVTSDVPVPITIPPFDRAEPVRNPALATRRITVHFDPLAAGAAEETLEVVSNSFGGETQAIPLYGRGISAFPEIRLSLVNNNAGGVALGAGNRRVEDFATLSNEGSQELRLTGVRILPAEPPQFSITGLPVVTPDNPLLLQPGQMLPLGFEFDPATPGLQVVKVEFESNDPATPVLRASLVGTGVPDTGAQPAYGMDFVQLQTSGSAGDQVFRVISEAAGGFRFFLPPEVDFRAAWFDPVTGLFAEQSGVTSSSGQPTKLLIPTFGASVAPDRDHDGLPDDIENTVGTSEDHPDSDGDGQDDFVEVVSLHTNPNDGRLTARGALSGVSFSSSVMGVSVGRSTGVAPSDLAVVVTKNGGVAVVDVSNPSQPLALGERKIADGEGRSVLYDPQRNRAYAGFATGALLDRGMFHIADLTDSANPRSVASFPLPAAPRGIAADAERLFLGIGESLAWFDPDTEGFVDSLNLDGGRVTDVAVIARNRLAVMTGNEFLIAVEVDDNTGRLRQKERVVTDGGGGIFYRDPILYTAAARRPIVNSGGYNTVDGRTWQVISRADNPSATILPGQFVAVSDAGLVALFGSTQFGPQMTVLDGSDPTRTDVFQYGNPLLGGPQWIVFAKGLAFVG
ncbi:MAG: hypothetical protein HYY24_15065, partial [Verrucomicrobia bacterium]|nr:hypothetical protein [Verrucomicrobiota bacterium]